MALEDSEIVALLYARSERAIEALGAKYGAAIWRIAMNILNDRRDAQECVNDTYLGVWNSVPPQNPDPLVAYVCKIARNAAINRYHANLAGKRNSRYAVALEELVRELPSRETVESEYDARELARAIDRFLAGLPAVDRVLFVRRYWYADSVADIAAALRLRGGAVSLRLFRVRKRLRAFLMKEGIWI